MNTLPELALIYGLQSLADAYKSRHGRHVTDVSHWDPSPEVISALNPGSLSSYLGHPTPYRYSYTINRLPQMLMALGLDIESDGALVTENGTSAIVAVANWLSLMNVRDVTLLTPCYFAISHNITRLGIRVHEVKLSQPDDAYCLSSKLKLKRGQALWVTNPVFNTGTYLSTAFCRQLARIAQDGVVVVADETVALTSNIIGRTLAGHQNFIGIYSPHKSVCMNSLKFAVLVFDAAHRDTFKFWADVLAGGLSLSAIAAIDHFLSPAFAEYQAKFLTMIEASRNWHTMLLANTNGAVQIDHGRQQGHLLTIYAPRVDARLESDLAFLGELTEKTGCVVLPGVCSRSDSTRGFSFRLNLARDSTSFRTSLPRLYDALKPPARPWAVRATAAPSRSRSPSRSAPRA